MQDFDTSEATIGPIFVSVKQAAKALNISPWTCYQLLDDPDCPLTSKYQGRRRLVVVDSLREYAAGLPGESEKSAS